MSDSLDPTHLVATESRLMNDGVYCTPFLLWSLYAHSATHCPGFEQQQAHFRVSCFTVQGLDNGIVSDPLSFKARAHLLLTKELCKGKAATLPLAQGLILLAGTAAARSDHSLAWTLSFTGTLAWLVIKSCGLIAYFARSDRYGHW